LDAEQFAVVLHHLEWEPLHAGQLHGIAAAKHSRDSSDSQTWFRWTQRECLWPNQAISHQCGSDLYDERNEQLCFAAELVEFVDHNPGCEMVIGNRKFVRRANGEWDEAQSPENQP
jgi:hypothetical protein